MSNLEVYKNDLDSFFDRAVLKSDIKLSLERPVLINLYNMALASKIPASDFVKFIHKCQKLGADPTLDQAYLIPYEDYRSGKVSGQIMFHYSFVESIAAAQGDYRGYERNTYVDDYFCPSTLESRKMLRCDVVVFRGDRKFPFTAWFDEYAKKKNDGTLLKNWKASPYLMIEKCSLVGALRRAYPEAMSGIYVQEESGVLENSELVEEIERKEKEAEKIEKYNKVKSDRIEFEKIQSGEKDKIKEEIRTLLNAICIKKNIETAIEKIELLSNYAGVASFKELDTLKTEQLIEVKNKLNVDVKSFKV